MAQEIRPETRLSKDFVNKLLAVVENEGLEMAGSARILAAKDRRSTARASDLLAALLVSRSGMFGSSSEIRAQMIRALCDEAVHYCFDPESGATLIQVILGLSLGRYSPSLSLTTTIESPGRSSPSPTRSATP